MRPGAEAVWVGGFPNRCLNALAARGIGPWDGASGLGTQESTERPRNKLKLVFGTLLRRHSGRGPAVDGHAEPEEDGREDVHDRDHEKAAAGGAEEDREGEVVAA